MNAQRDRRIAAALLRGSGGRRSTAVVVNLLLALLVIGCDTTTDSNPPAWIYGTWVPCTRGSEARWEFGPGKVLFVVDGRRTDYSSLSGGVGVSISEEADDDSYSISYANGPADSVYVLFFSRLLSGRLRYAYYYRLGDLVVREKSDWCREGDR